MKQSSPYGNVIFKTVQQYHLHQTAHAQAKLNELRSLIISLLPHVTECISYNMPCFKTSSVVLYYAAFKNHIGFYPTPEPIRFFEKELKSFTTSKGAIQFPLNQPLPLALIQKIIKFRIQQINNQS